MMASVSVMSVMERTGPNPSPSPSFEDIYRILRYLQVRQMRRHEPGLAGLAKLVYAPICWITRLSAVET